MPFYLDLARDLLQRSRCCPPDPHPFVVWHGLAIESYFVFDVTFGGEGRSWDGENWRGGIATIPISVILHGPKGQPYASPGQAERRSREASPWVCNGRSRNSPEWAALIGATV